MKKLAPVLMIFLLLCACSKHSKDEADALRGHYRNLESAEYTVTQRTDFGDRVMDFQFTYFHSPADGDTIELLAPEAIKGIRAVLKGEGAQVEFEGMVLELGKLPGTGLSPLEVMPFMMSQWRSGHVTSEGSEKLNGVSCRRLNFKTIQGEVSVEHSAWFDQETYAPVRAELFFDTALVAACEFE